MWILKLLFLSMCGISFGVAVAGGYLALISMIGILPRLASVTKTVKQMIHYENGIIYGVLAGNLISLFHFFVPGETFICLIIGFFGGVFTGCLAGALAEVVNVIPVFARRAGIRKGISYLIYALAFGKGMGVFFQYFLF